MKPSLLLEACVEDYAQAKKAWDLGAHRLELCMNLNEGGLTPSYGFIEKVQQTIFIPSSVMIRAKAGPFTATVDELDIMQKDIEVCKKLNVYGVVFGLLTPKKTIDIEAIKKLVIASKPMAVTFHMAFDQIEDKKEALEQLVELGVDRVLTKGGKLSAMDGKEILKDLIIQAQNRIVVMPGGKVTNDNVNEIATYTGAIELHGTKIVGQLI